MKLSIREALESSCPAHHRETKWPRVASFPNSREVTLHKDVVLRFLSEVSSNGEEDMTVSELVGQLEDYP